MSIKFLVLGGGAFVPFSLSLLVPPDTLAWAAPRSIAKRARGLREKREGEGGERGCGLREGSCSCNGGMWGPSKRQLGPDPRLEDFPERKEEEFPMLSSGLVGQGKNQ